MITASKNSTPTCAVKGRKLCEHRPSWETAEHNIYMRKYFTV